MAGQFDVFRTVSGSVVVVIQHGLIDGIQTRAVAALIPEGKIGRTASTLNPKMIVGGDAYTLMPQVLATLTLAELNQKIGSLADERDKIIRAVDTLLAGV